ncbi:MAG: M23 family metallopeptidase, partial [Leptolyngbya sp. Prado105]|nr:M23 family metallopeptidase [Leptolyngbya sp. Prado105]
VILCFVLSLGVMTISSFNRVTAQVPSTSFVAIQNYSQGNLNAPVPDWSQITFASLPPINQNAEFVPPNGLSLNSRSIQVGMTADQYLKLGDFQDSLYLQNLTLEQISSSSQAKYDLSQVVLKGFGLIREQTLGSLVETIPGLGDFSVEQVPPIAALLKQSNLLGRSLNEILKWKPNLADLKLGSINLDQFSIADIPGLKDIPLENLQQWQNSAIADVPGLKDMPFSKFPVALVTAGAIGVIDIAYGEKESDRANTITGSDVQGFRVPCQKNCAYAELTGTEALHGKQWISGKYQKVKGGSGPLAVVNGGKEPTGRHPYGKAFKVVIWDVVESEGRVDTAIFFRICHRVFGIGKTCTPYFIGPIPFMSYHEENPILVGLLDNEGGATTGASIPQEVLDKAKAVGVSLSENGELSEFADTSLCGSGLGGVDLAALASGISGIEGGYGSAGYFDPEAGGRGLGRYQYMTFRDDVRSIIAKHPGGEDFLRRADINDNSSAYRTALERELPNYFTQADQDALFKQDQTNNIRIAMQQTDPTTGQPFTGMRLIERLGQIHFGGANSAIDGGSSDIHGRLSIHDYGKELARNYQSASKQSSRDCAGNGKATGKMIYPEGANAPTPPGGYFGADRGDHVHAGVDFSVPMGTPIKAADGGVVEFAGRTDPDGYGTLIIVDHGNGLKTYYGHPSQINVKTGQKISQGQVIGQVGAEGDSTGPHLHFEVRRNGSPVDPMRYLPQESRQ